MFLWPTSVGAINARHFCEENNRNHSVFMQEVASMNATTAWHHTNDHSDVILSKKWCSLMMVAHQRAIVKTSILYDFSDPPASASSICIFFLRYIEWSTPRGATNANLQINHTECEAKCFWDGVFSIFAILPPNRVGTMILHDFLTRTRWKQSHRPYTSAVSLTKTTVQTSHQSHNWHTNRTRDRKTCCSRKRLIS